MQVRCPPASERDFITLSIAWFFCGLRRIIMYDRTLKILNKEIFMKIQNSKILLIGLGGVGGYTLEALVRIGFLYITVVDMDIFDESNLNRQILSTLDTIGEEKVLVAKKRANLINPECQITPIQKKLYKEDITSEFLKDFDYIIDACDSKEVKIELIRKCTSDKKKIISCMGTANRVHPEDLEITRLESTFNDPLAKVLRHELRGEKNCLKTTVVCSKELPKKQKELGTICPVPMSAGSLLASYVINDILKES